MTEAEERDLRSNMLTSDLIETMLAGLKRHRPDLNYPASHSDMRACVRAMLTMFDVTRKPLAETPKV